MSDKLMDEFKAAAIAFVAAEVRRKEAEAAQAKVQATAIENFRAADNAYYEAQMRLDRAVGELLNNVRERAATS